MRCGAYGKLPAKRDFIAIAAPRSFLELWEPWLQTGVAHSRDRMGAEWLDSFLHAPIWRFWLGADLCGATAAGAFMPSVDGAGRYFPLTIFAVAETGVEIPPPQADRQDGWFEAVEDLLLYVLGEQSDFATFAGRVETLPTPSTMESAAGRPPGAASAGPEKRIGPRQSVWWTLGGGAIRPVEFTADPLPDPQRFTAMLTGRFEPAHI